MKLKNFVEGMNILSKYLDKEKADVYGTYNEHISIIPNTGETKVSCKDKRRLKELGFCSPKSGPWEGEWLALCW